MSQDTTALLTNTLHLLHCSAVHPSKMIMSVTYFVTIGFNFLQKFVVCFFCMNIQTDKYQNNFKQIILLFFS